MVRCAALCAVLRRMLAIVSINVLILTVSFHACPLLRLQQLKIERLLVSYRTLADALADFSRPWEQESLIGAARSLSRSIQ